MKNYIRNGFNAAACLTGTAASASSAFMMLWASEGSSGGFIDLTPDFSAFDYAIATAIMTAGATLFTLGYSRFFGSGKAMSAIKSATSKMLDKIEGKKAVDTKSVAPTEGNKEAAEKGIYKSFNLAATYAGGLTAMVSGFMLYINTTSSTPEVSEMLLSGGLTLAGAVLFTAGFSHFFGSGKTVKALRSTIGETQNQPTPTLKP